MDDLAQWLTAQLDEDTRTASSWHTLDCDIHAHLEGDAESVTATMAMFYQAPGLVCDCGGPARVLREIDAKRQAVAHFERVRKYARDGALDYALAEGAVAMQLKIMTLPYADRPGYLETWRP